MPDNSKYPHRQPVQLRFNDFDLLGHMNNTVYFELFDLAKLRFLQDVMGSTFNFAAECLVMANVNCNFLKSVSLNHQIEVLSRVESVSEHSLVIHQIMVDSRGDIKAECASTMVAVDMRTGSTIEVLDSWRRLINEYHR